MAGGDKAVKGRDSFVRLICQYPLDKSSLERCEACAFLVQNNDLLNSADIFIDASSLFSRYFPNQRVLVLPCYD